ncbi:hypothetical protein M5689_020757 [Euphorbia peplus]|nr:hypothetical protein M5689_020757 [Euphorbia peplus]
MVLEQRSEFNPTSTGPEPIPHHASAVGATIGTDNTEFTLITDTTSSTIPASQTIPSQTTQSQLQPFAAHSQPPSITSAYTFSSWNGGEFPQTSSLHYGPPMTNNDAHSTISSTFIPLSHQPMKYTTEKYRPSPTLPSTVHTETNHGPGNPPRQPHTHAHSPFPPLVPTWNQVFAPAQPINGSYARPVPSNITISIKLTPQIHWNIVAIMRSHRLYDHIQFTGAPPP